MDLLSEYVARRYSVHLWCKSCPHHAEADLASIIARHGDMTFDAFRRRLRCTACGSRDVQTIITPPYQWNEPDLYR